MPLTVDDKHLAGVLCAHETEETALSQEDIVRRALENPIGSPRLRALAETARRVLVISSDHTRPVPSALTMPLLLREIRSGNPDAEIRVLVATGMHRPTTREELLAKYGAQIVENETIVIHDSRRDEDMAFKGTLPSGGELWLNRLVDWADLVVSEGFIEPHFFAGFSGGRKSVLPGIASHKTVLYNHNSAFIRDANAVQGNLSGNPLHRDMLFAARAAGLRFILNVLLDGDKRVVAAYAGDREAAHEAGCAQCLRRTRVPMQSADIVVTSNGGYPLDQNIYQAVKGMSTGALCVRAGGVLIMLAQCEDGHGGEAFCRWFTQAQNAREVADAIDAIAPEDTQADQWEAQILARVLLRCECIFVTDEKNADLIQGMHMRYAATADAALAMARAIAGSDASVLVIPDGVGAVPTEG